MLVVRRPWVCLLWPPFASRSKTNLSEKWTSVHFTSTHAHKQVHTNKRTHPHPHTHTQTNTQTDVTHTLTHIHTCWQDRWCWCLRGLCGNPAWLCKAAVEVVTSLLGYSRHVQGQGSAFQKTLDLPGQLRPTSLCVFVSQTLTHTQTQSNTSSQSHYHMGRYIIICPPPPARRIMAVSLEFLCYG